jgi:hypothetical protein
MTRNDSSKKKNKKNQKFVEKKKMKKNGLGNVDFVKEGLDYLENNGAIHSEGIFRLSGDSSVMNDFKKKLESGKKVSFSELKDINAVAGLIKLYFRELPEPLCTFDNFEMFMAAVGIPDEDQKLIMIKKVLKFLPNDNLKLIQVLCKFLKKVSSNSEENMMNSKNLAICFSPNLLKRRPNEKLDNLQQIQEMLKDAPYATDLMTLFIEKYDDLLKEVELEGNDKFSINLSKVEKYEGLKSPREKTEKKSSPSTVESYLNKKGDIGIIKNWKKRYFKIEDDQINYYTMINGEFKGNIFLNEIVDLKDEDSYKFQIICETRIFYLEAFSDSEKKGWFEAIQSYLKGKKEIEKQNNNDEKENLKKEILWNKFLCSKEGSNWVTLKTKEGKIYYGNKKTKETQWDFPLIFHEFVVELKENETLDNTSGFLKKKGTVIFVHYKIGWYCKKLEKKIFQNTK